MNSEQPGWWRRNWKWAAPSGCLLVLLLAFGGCMALVAGVFGMMKNTGAYVQAIERVQQNPDAVAALGEPITAGWMMSGSFNDNGDTGDAEYSVPVSGPRGSGTLVVRAIKRGGRWSFSELTLLPDGGDPIDLRTPEEIGETGGAPVDDGYAPTDDGDIEREDGQDAVGQGDATRV